MRGFSRRERGDGGALSISSRQSWLYVLSGEMRGRMLGPPAGQKGLSRMELKGGDK